MNKHIVSILIPAYNATSFLPECLNSVLNQTYKDLQVVLVDDGSTDNTLSLCNEYAARDNRVEVYHQENQGVATTRNHLLDRVKGDWVLFVDADDWVELDMVEFLVNKADESGADIITCKEVVNNQTVTTDFSEVLYDKDITVKEFLRHVSLRGSLWNKLIKRCLCENVSFHPAISYGEDALFCWRLIQKVDRLLFTDRQLYHYRMNVDGLSHSMFGPKKLSGHLTWSIISEETEKSWPQYAYIAKARWAIEDIQLVRAAARDGYPYDNYVEELQDTVKNNYRDIIKANITTTKMVLYAFVASRCYRFAAWF